MKRLLIQLFPLIPFLLMPHLCQAITPPAGPNVTLDTAFEGTWVSTIPAGCGGVTEDTSARRAKATLRLCVKDSELGPDRELRGQMRTGFNMRMLQNDASYQPVGRNLRMIESMSLDTEDGARSAFTELRGKKSRTTNLVLEISDGVEEDGTDAGNLVGTMGNCGVGMVWRRVKATSSCSFKKRRKSRRRSR